MADTRRDRLIQAKELVRTAEQSLQRARSLISEDIDGQLLGMMRAAGADMRDADHALWLELKDTDS